MNVHLDFRGGGDPSNRNASRDESVETGAESTKPVEKHNNHVIMWMCNDTMKFGCHVIPNT